MNRTLACGIFALAALAAPMPASAQALPLSLPTPEDVAKWVQTATQTQASCPAVEIAPGVLVPVPCVNALPKPPPNAPTVDPISALFAPPMVDLRMTGRDGPIKDQGQTGVCYAFAMTTVMEDDLRSKGRSEVLSPLHIVAADAWDDLWTGHPREAITTESLWPYDPKKACRFKDGVDGTCERAYGVSTGSWRSDPRLVFERERARANGAFYVARARTFKKGDFASILGALAQGRAVYASIDIDSVAWGFRGVQGGVLPEYERADRGGHAVAIVGYRTLPTGRQYLLHNSWGTKWGDGGYAWMSEAGVRKHLIDAHLIDALPVKVAPQEVARCPSGAPPFMGQCWLG
jgi:hypothetical protein